MNGFHNKVLHVDVNQRSFIEESVGDEVYKMFLGGKGLGTHLLLNNTKAGVEPLSEHNALIFATGPAADTMVWGSSRYGVFTKSPLTGLYSESYAGGRVAEPISRAGYDAVVIKGASQKPVYLEIINGNVKFHDASHIWGRDTHETEEIIRQEVVVKDAGIAVIGPAGENLVRFSVIENDYWRSIGRTGAGAVMGSKKIKGIVFHGSRDKRVANPDLLRKFWEELRDKGKEDPGAKKYREMGTLQLVPLTNKAGAFPTKYWSSGAYDKWQNLTIEALREKCKVRSRACPKCFMACGKLSEVLKGRHKGLKIEGPEYETVNSFGGLCLVDDIREIMYLNDICDRLGMDTITAGNLAGFTIEASRRGAIGEKIDYSDVDGIASLLNSIARKEGIGAILAEGIKHASREWGLEDLAIHVKGLEPPGYDPRILKGMGLGYATAGRGACHLRATFYKPELAGIVSPDQIECKAKVFTEWEDRLTVMDALIICRFFRDLYLWEEFSLIIKAVTGMLMDESQLKDIASNIASKVREFNLREGMKEEDEMLPKRFLEEKLEDSGKVLPKDEFDQMLADYYRIRGWD
ncbi:MAG: aldehyde ferredoxin oxidoreductase family protein [Chloroflexota bacterium]|nr:aldehyde ferredoxin oxidoreductase family protein [Chloroflexota bacterium]